MFRVRAAFACRKDCCRAQTRFEIGNQALRGLAPERVEEVNRYDFRKAAAQALDRAFQTRIVAAGLVTRARCPRQFATLFGDCRVIGIASGPE